MVDGLELVLRLHVLSTVSQRENEGFFILLPLTCQSRGPRDGSVTTEELSMFAGHQGYSGALVVAQIMKRLCCEAISSSFIK